MRNQDKLIFGSDCACADGRKGASAPDVFRQLTWTNARQLFRLGV